jgi:hypothetical protein
MKSLKRISAVVALTIISLGLSAVAGQTQSPPCGSNDPGETHSPPCATYQITNDDSATPGGVTTPPDSTDYIITQAAVDFVENVLTLF